MKQTNAEQISKSMKILDELRELRGGSLADVHPRVANDPQLLESYLQTYITNFNGDNTIPDKYRELIITAVACSRGVLSTSKGHALLALEMGATMEEVTETMRLVLFLEGVNALFHVAEIFDPVSAQDR